MKEAGAKFFADTQLRLGDPFTLSSYLVKPFERMARYKLFILVRPACGEAVVMCSDVWCRGDV